jgi:hypothetical protein
MCGHFGYLCQYGSIQGADGVIACLESVVIDNEAWLKLFSICEFGGSLHPVLVIQAKTDLFDPFLAGVIFE